MIYFYTNNKDEDYTEEKIKELANKGFNCLICDFEPKEDLTERLSKYDIISYYRIQLYCRPTLEEIKEEVIRAKKFDFYGVAFDGEAYSNSTIWQEKDTMETYKECKKIVREHFDTPIVVYPEYLGMGDKYLYYTNWLEVVADIVLMERTYQDFLPWVLFHFWNRARKTVNKEYVIGIWPDTLKYKILKWIQRKSAEIICKNLFYYTEEKL